MPSRRLGSVTIEESNAAHVDSITMVYAAEAARPDPLFQIKYRVDQRSHYSTDALLESKGKGKEPAP